MEFINSYHVAVGDNRYIALYYFIIAVPYNFLSFP